MEDEQIIFIHAFTFSYLLCIYMTRTLAGLQCSIVPLYPTCAMLCYAMLTTGKGLDSLLGKSITLHYHTMQLLADNHGQKRERIRKCVEPTAITPVRANLYQTMLNKGTFAIGSLV